MVQTTEARTFSDEEIRMLQQAAAEVAPVIGEARALDRFIAPVQESSGRWRGISGGVGITTPLASSAIWIRFAGAAESQPCGASERNSLAESSGGPLS